MLILILGLILFLGIHSTPILARDWRRGFVAERGEKAWKLLFSLVALLGLILLIYGYGLTRSNPVFIWQPPVWTRHTAILLNLVAFLLLPAAYVPRNHLRYKLGHPMYAGVKIWAFAHLIANGRLGDMVLFGAFLVWAIVGFASARRRDRQAGVVYSEPSWGGTLLSLVIGLLLWAAFVLYLHQLLIGVAPI